MAEDKAEVVRSINYNGKRWHSAKDFAPHFVTSDVTTVLELLDDPDVSDFLPDSYKTATVCDHDPVRENCPCGLSAKSSVSSTSGMSAPLRLRCQTRGGLKSLDGLTPDSTVADLVLAVSTATAIPAGRLKIKVGFPPKAIDTSEVSRSLADLQVRSGDKITVDEDSSISGGDSPAHSPAKLGGTERAAVAASDSLLQQQLASGTKGVLQRKVVPADNSCLFTSINALMTDGSVDHSGAEELRQLIAGVVCSDPVTYSSAFLGRPNQDYVNWILNKDSWGGGIEVDILANYYQTEIAVVDCQSARIDRFGEDKNFTRRIFLLYDGVHYDPLVLEAPDGSGTILEMIFSAEDDAIMLQAMEIAREAQASGQFTNMAEFALRCLICRTPLKGEKEAQQHALVTKHDRYGEYRP